MPAHPPAHDRQLTLDDIVDLRAYERERKDFRAHVIDLKRKRRVHVGPIVTFVFENRDTIRFQIQEMARVERIITDEGIQTELDIYNPLIPSPGHLSTTMFLELTDDAGLREWLPKLVGIEIEVELRIGTGDDVAVVRCDVDPAHAQALTRDEMTASVHYVSFALDPAQVDRFASEPVALAITHPNYQHHTALSEASVAELLTDLRA
ncbi:MAG TPA: DUF3501 family protein [Acidimicrobiales bacterium]|jgi:hypothetical protein|nr:DUF3501 family protein [Acidimicrobiales bacterium]